MIVQCDKCETKFRIADDKVTGGGVKVRCSKCAHVFVVRKDGGGLADPAGTPSLHFGEVAGPTVKVAAESMASFAQGSMAPNLHRASTVPLARSIPTASTAQVAAALGFGSAPPPRAPVPAFATNTGLPSFSDGTKKELPTFPDSNPNNERLAEPRPLSEVKTEQMRLPQKRDPFHELPPPGSSPGTDVFGKVPSAPGFFPPPQGGLIEPFPKVPSSVTDPFPKASSESSYNPFGKIPTGSGVNNFLEAPTLGEAKYNPKPNPFLSPDPFGGPPPSSDPLPPPPLSRAVPDAFDASILPPPPMGGIRPDSNPFQNPPAPGPDLLQRGPAKVDPTRQTFFPPPVNLPKPPSNESIPPPVADHDPFANIDIEVPSKVGPAEDAFFDAPAEPVAPALKPQPALEPLARINFGNVVAPIPRSEVSHAKTAVAATYREEDEDEGAIGVWPTALGVVLGAIIALFVFPGLIGDWMDLRIGTELIQPKKLLPESLDHLRAMGARVTSYEGKNGAHMLVVSGSARNDGMEKVDNIQAVALMLEGEEIVERRRAFVGVPLDEATLAGLENAADLDNAYRAAKDSATPEMLEIGPGANARFVVVFPAIPENIETRKFRVEFVKASVPAP